MEVLNIRIGKHSMTINAIYPCKEVFRVVSLNTNRLKIPKLKPCKLAIKKSGA